MNITAVRLTGNPLLKRITNITKIRPADEFNNVVTHKTNVKS